MRNLAIYAIINYFSLEICTSMIAPFKHLFCFIRICNDIYFDSTHVLRTTSTVKRGMKQKIYVYCEIKIDFTGRDN